MGHEEGRGHEISRKAAIDIWGTRSGAFLENGKRRAWSGAPYPAALLGLCERLFRLRYHRFERRQAARSNESPSNIAVCIENDCRRKFAAVKPSANFVPFIEQDGVIYAGFENAAL